MLIVVTLFFLALGRTFQSKNFILFFSNTISLSCFASNFSPTLSLFPSSGRNGYFWIHPLCLTFVSCFLHLCAFPLFSGKILQFNHYTNLLISVCVCVLFYVQTLYLTVCYCLNAVSSCIFLSTLIYCISHQFPAVVGSISVPRCISAFLSQTYTQPNCQHCIPLSNGFLLPLKPTLLPKL